MSVLPRMEFRSGPSTPSYNNYGPRTDPTQGLQNHANIVQALNNQRFDDLVAQGLAISPGQREQQANILQGYRDLLSSELGQGSGPSGGNTGIGGGAGGSGGGGSFGGLPAPAVPQMPQRVNTGDLRSMAQWKPPPLPEAPARMAALSAPDKVGRPDMGRFSGPPSMPNTKRPSQDYGNVPPKPGRGGMQSGSNGEMRTRRKPQPNTDMQKMLMRQLLGG